MIEINSLTEFKKIILKNKGLVVITSTKPFHYIHYPSCRLIKEVNFKKKVITNKKKAGSYFLFNNYNEAKKNNAKLTICRHCKIKPKNSSNKS